jgi:pimeloyl-ACP methyl ester carboxylesterase
MPGFTSPKAEQSFLPRSHPIRNIETQRALHQCRLPHRFLSLERTCMSLLLIALIVLAVLVVGHLIFSAIVRKRNPPIGQFIEVDGVRLHYIERGPADGASVLFLHGNGAMIQDLTISRLVDLAAQKFRVICFDRPGFGYSSRPRWRVWTPQAQATLLGRAVHQLGAARPIVLGHSWGTLVALAMALAGEAKGLVLVSGYYFPTRRVDVWLLAGPAIPILGDLMRYTIAPLGSWLLLPKLLKILFTPRPVSDVFAQEFPLALTVRPTQLRSAAEESAMLIWAAATLAPQYPQLACPVAVMAGDQDRVVEHDQASRLHATLRRSVLKVIPDAGHMVHHAAPERIYEGMELISAWPAWATPD